DQARDVVMSEPRENAALAAKPRLAAAPDERGIEKLDRDLAFEAPVAAACEPDTAHAALPELRFERVGTEDLSSERRAPELLGDQHQEARLVRRAQLGEHRLDLGGESGVFGAELRQPLLALARGELKQLVEQRTDDLPPRPVNAHGASPVSCI